MLYFGHLQEEVLPRVPSPGGAFSFRIIYFPAQVPDAKVKVLAVNEREVVCRLSHTLKLFFMCLLLFFAIKNRLELDSRLRLPAVGRRE